MEVSTLIGTEIFSPAGEKLGYVKTVYLSKDRKKITCLSCVDEAQEENDEFVMPFRAVLFVKDVVIAKKQRIAKAVGVPAPIGMSAYSDIGEALGILSEISIREENTVYVLSKNGVNTAYSEQAVTVGEALMIKSNAPRTSFLAPQKETTAIASVPNKTPASNNALNYVPTYEQSYDSPREQTQAGVDRLNLLGRRVKITVRDKDGTPIAVCGERITPEILSLARRNNLLLRLTVNTLTNIV